GGASGGRRGIRARCRAHGNCTQHNEEHAHPAVNLYLAPKHVHSLIPLAVARPINLLHNISTWCGPSDCKPRKAGLPGPLCGKRARVTRLGDTPRAQRSGHTSLDTPVDRTRRTAGAADGTPRQDHVQPINRAVAAMTALAIAAWAIAGFAVAA